MFENPVSNPIMSSRCRKNAITSVGWMLIDVYLQKGSSLKQDTKKGLPVPAASGTARPSVLDKSAHGEASGRANVVARIRSGLIEAGRGAGRPVDELFDELERERRLRH